VLVIGEEEALRIRLSACQSLSGLYHERSPLCLLTRRISIGSGPFRLKILTFYPNGRLRCINGRPRPRRGLFSWGNLAENSAGPEGMAR